MEQNLDEFNLTILSNLPNPVLAVNPDTSIRYVNPAFEKLTGFVMEELTGIKAPYPWWQKWIRKNRVRQLLAVMERGEDIERINRKKNGESFWVRISSRPVYIDGEFRFFLSNWTEITERKRVERQRNKLTRELRDLSQHLQHAREEERAQIARQVHDELGQTIAALKMDVCWLEKQLNGKAPRIDGTLKSMNAVIDNTLQQIKLISTGLRPSLLDDIGLSDAIEWQAAQFQNVTGIGCHTAINEKCNELDRDKSISLYRIFQEAISNIFVHARATSVNIVLNRTRQHVVLEIADNGIGITGEQLADPKAFGLIGMREAVHYCGGKIRITGSKEKGTSIKVRIPLGKETR